MRSLHDFPTRLPPKRRSRPREPRLRADVPGAHGGGEPHAQEAPHRDLPARRGGRPERRRALRRARLLPPAADDRDSAPRRRRRWRARSRRLLRVPPAAGAARAALQERHSRRDPRVRVARQHALALRRAGLHGIGHARREEHRRWVAEPDVEGGARRQMRRRFARWRSRPRCRDRCRAPRRRWRSDRSDSSASTTARAADARRVVRRAVLRGGRYRAEGHGA